jgi:hypothetical protein
MSEVFRPAIFNEVFWPFPLPRISYLMKTEWKNSSFTLNGNGMEKLNANSSDAR